MECNGPQNEVGGKSLFIQKCKEFTAVATTDESENLTVTGHGLSASKPTDLASVVQFKAIGGNTVIALNGSNGKPRVYFVKQIVDANTLKISATPGGVAIEFDATSSALEADLFRNVGGIRGKTSSLSVDGIDITNQDSNEWQTMLDAAGIRKVEFSGDGVYTNETVAKEIHKACRENNLVCLALVEAKTGFVTFGCFKITSAEVGGSYDGEGSASFSGSSSGEIYFFDAASP